MPASRFDYVLFGLEPGPVFVDEEQLLGQDFVGGLSFDRPHLHVGEQLATGFVQAWRRESHCKVS